MSKKKKRYIPAPQIQKSTSFETIDEQIKRLTLEKSLLLDKSLSSNSVDDILKAQSYLKHLEEKKKQDDIKAFFFAPDYEFSSGNGYKRQAKTVGYELLRRMGETPQIHAVIATRINQILNFRSFTTDLQRQGWTIQRKKSLLDEEKKELTNQDKREIEKIASFIINGGESAKWDMNDDFDDFLKKFTRDSMELDQATFEISRNKGSDVIGYFATPSDTMRFLETIDPKEREKYHYEDVKGYLPIYCQVWNNEIQKNWLTNEPIVYYPWELCFSIRNKSSDIRRNGYGRSELEILIEIVTWILWGMQYNGNFFKQGSNPKGFFTIDGALNPNTLNEMRSGWRNMMSGVENSHKIPILEGGKVNWVDMQKSNADMEFQNWNEFLILLTCSVYSIDPSELGFHFKNQSEMFGQQGQKERLEHSYSKGLIPLLKLIEKELNKYIVSEINDKFEFVFTGIDIEDEQAQLEMDVKKSAAGFTAMEDMFEKYSGRKFDPKKDTILNNVYLQAKQAAMMGGEESNQAVDEMTGEPAERNPFENFNKSANDNPIMGETIKFFEKAFGRN